MSIQEIFAWLWAMMAHMVGAVRCFRYIAAEELYERFIMQHVLHSISKSPIEETIRLFRNALDAYQKEHNVTGLNKLLNKIIKRSLQFKQVHIRKTDDDVWRHFWVAVNDARLRNFIVIDDDCRVRIDFLGSTQATEETAKEYAKLLSVFLLIDNFRIRSVDEVLHVCHARIKKTGNGMLYLDTARNTYTFDKKDRMRFDGFLRQGKQAYRLDSEIVDMFRNTWVEAYINQVNEAAENLRKEHAEENEIDVADLDRSALSRMNECGLLSARLMAELAVIMSKYCILGLFHMDTRGRGINPTGFIFNPWSDKRIRASLYIHTFWNEGTKQAVALFLHNELLKPKAKLPTNAQRIEYGYEKLEELKAKYEAGWQWSSDNPEFKEIWLYRIAKNYSKIANGKAKTWHVPVEVDQNASCLTILGVLLGNAVLMSRTNCYYKGDTLDQIIDPYTFKDIDPKWRGILKWIIMLFAFGHGTGSSKPIDTDEETNIEGLFYECLKSSTVTGKDKSLLVGEEYDKSKVYEFTPEIEAILHQLCVAAKSLPSTVYSRIIKRHGPGGSSVTFNIGYGTVSATSTKKEYSEGADGVLEPMAVYGDVDHLWYVGGNAEWYTTQDQIGFVPGTDMINYYLPTGLVHHLDSRVCEYVVRKVLSEVNPLTNKAPFCLSIHDAYVVDPNYTHVVKESTRKMLANIFRNGEAILQSFCKQCLTAGAYAELSKLRNFRSNNMNVHDKILNGSESMH